MRQLYPGAVDVLLRDFSSLTSFLQFPVEYRWRVRHTNLLERTFGESRRRTKVISDDTRRGGRLQDLRHQLLLPQASPALAGAVQHRPDQG